jgi:sec-independent protein translocase protein TatC
MTSGDGERVAPPPEMAANSSAVSAAASAAAMCYDSDDLLTPRRGGRPEDRSRPENGHTAIPEAPEQDVAGLEAMEPSETAPLPDATASANDAFSETSSEATPTIGAAPSETDAAPPPDAESAHHNGTVAVLAPPTTVAQQEATAGPVVEVDAGPHLTDVRSHRAMADDGTVSATTTDVAPAFADPLPGAPARNETAIPATEAPDEANLATSVREPGPEEAPDAPAQRTQDDTAETDLEDPVASTVSTNGFAHHTAETTEYTPVEHGGATEPVDVLLPVPGATEPPADEIIEIPLPIAGVEDRPVPGISVETAMDEPAGAVSAPDDVLTPPAEPITMPETQMVTEPVVLAEPDIPTIPPAAPPAPPLAATPPPPAAPPPEEGEEEGATMTIIEHLEELRHRITISAISIVVGAVIAWFIVPHVVHYLETAAQKIGGKFYSPTILGPFGLELKLSFLIGLIIASPVVLFQIWGFIAPGLTRREKRYALPFSLIGSGLFAAGAVTGILIVPLAIQFLTHFFAVLDLEQLLDIDKYIMFIALIAVIFGITFELPIFMVGFSLLGVVNSRFFIQKFRIAIFVIFGVSMVITPGADLISPLVLGGFLTILYWLGVFLIRIIGR